MPLIIWIVLLWDVSLYATLLIPHPSSSRDYLQDLLRVVSAPPVPAAASKRREGEERSREDVWDDVERVYLQSTFDLVCDRLFVLSLTTSVHLFVYKTTATTTHTHTHTHTHSHTHMHICVCVLPIYTHT